MSFRSTHGKINMNRENFEATVKILTEATPFQPYVIELHGGERFEVNRLGALACRGASAVFIGPGGELRIFDNDSVVQIINAPAHAIRPRKPKK
jgi:hypothetical protein